MFIVSLDYPRVLFAHFGEDARLFSCFLSEIPYLQDRATSQPTNELSVMKLSN